MVLVEYCRKVIYDHDENLLYGIGDRPIMAGEMCEKGSQLRPHVVWFGENVLH